VARWLAGQGFSHVAVLEGGLDGWIASGLPLEKYQDEAPLTSEDSLTASAGLTRAESFLPSLADRYLSGRGRPVRRRLATLFVDIAGSTRLVEHHPAETVLRIVQRFMHLVTDVALAYCGDVKDFEGDGALLYFESPSESAQAALAIRAALNQQTSEAAHPVAARMSLTIGHVVIGLVGSAMRSSIALIGTSVHVGARLLKHVPPGGIIATSEFVESLHTEGSALAEQFRLHEEAFEVPGSDGIAVTTYIAT
jgi:class 3 adenylate cyclase